LTIKALLQDIAYILKFETSFDD